MENDKINEFQKINTLLAFYAELLTEQQLEIIEKYYAFDLSLGEISIEKQISRTAVQDCLKKSIAKLENYESKLHLIEKEKQLQEVLDVAKKTNNQEVLHVIAEIERVNR